MAAHGLQPEAPSPDESEASLDRHDEGSGMTRPLHDCRQNREDASIVESADDGGGGWPT